ncbi:hypothetical protein TNCV_3480131 [Trichonephila clavipes]|nr:hypothetical protein TNCV_3480131 [Trichonephila clavipes]
MAASYCFSHRSIDLYWRKTGVIDFHNLHLIPISYHSGSFAMQKGSNHLLPVPDYMVDALKLFNQAPRASGESLQKCVAWSYDDETIPILAVSSQSLASNGFSSSKRCFQFLTVNI